MIFRDDDISWKTKTEDFIGVNEIFKQYKVIHHIAVIAKDLEKMDSKLIGYIKDNKNISVQLHCWEHLHYPLYPKDEVFNQLEMALEKICKVFNVYPTFFFPPWNDMTPEIKMVADRLGLISSWQKISFSQYIKTRGYVLEDVINFHYWAYEETQFLETALSIYNENMAK